MNIKGILISIIAPFENHIANGGEKLLGNASSIKRRPDGRVYVSGQMVRHVLFSAIDRLNRADNSDHNTFISNGDGITNKIETDLRADLGGFMHPSKGNYSGRRTSPLSVTPAVALKPSSIGRDLLVRLKQESNDSDQKQALATNEFSEKDLMQMNFFLDISAVGISKAFEYRDKYFYTTKFFKHVTETERRRRVELFIEATKSLTDFANQARNAINAEPQKVLICFDTKLSRKASRYFVASDIEKKNIIQELEDRNAIVMLGNDIEGVNSVDKAYKKAIDVLNNSTLFDPSKIDDKNILTFDQAYGNS